MQKVLRRAQVYTSRLLPQAHLFRLEPELGDEGGHHRRGDDRGHQDTVFGLVDDAVGQSVKRGNAAKGEAGETLTDSPRHPPSLL